MGKVRRREGVARVVSVQTTATELLPANPARVKFFVANRSANPGALTFDGSDPSTSRGYPMTAQGGNITVERDGPEGVGASVCDKVRGINETGAGDWYVEAWEEVPDGR